MTWTHCRFTTSTPAFIQHYKQPDQMLRSHLCVVSTSTITPKPPVITPEPPTECGGGEFVVWTWVPGSLRTANWSVVWYLAAVNKLTCNLTGLCSDSSVVMHSGRGTNTFRLISVLLSNKKENQSTTTVTRNYYHSKIWLIHSEENSFGHEVLQRRLRNVKGCHSLETFNFWSKDE